MAYMNRIFMSPDGKLVALSPSGTNGQYGVHLFSLETRELKPLVLAGDFKAKGFSEDGKE